MKKSIMILGLAGFMAMSGCNDSSDSTASAGPVDGTWKVTTWTCGTRDVLTAAGSPTIKATISNTSGSNDVTVSASCTQTIAQTFAYSGTSVTMTSGATTCSSACSGAQCTAAAASNSQSVYTYTLTGTTILSLTRTLTAAMISANTMLTGCAASSTETLYLTKQ